MISKATPLTFLDALPDGGRAVTTDAATRVLLVDDSPLVRATMRRALEHDGFQVRDLPTANDIERHVDEFSPQVIVCDLLMPERDGMAVFHALQERDSTRYIPFILATAEEFASPKHALSHAGIAHYLAKPLAPATLVSAVRDTLDQQAGLRIWGCRGSVAAPEQALGNFGGNTACVELVLNTRESGNHRLIFDAGTGIRGLGNSIAVSSPLHASLFLTHFHWDHIQGLPFFKPLYRPGNEITIYGPAASDAGLLEAIQGQMGGSFFPISTDAFLSSVKYIGLQEQTLDIGGLQVSSLAATHPGFTLGYKVSWGNRSVAYVPDNELLPELLEPELSGDAVRLVEWLRGTNLLIHDCQYSTAGYLTHRGWGHSGAKSLAAVVAAANVGRVLLFHHDPDYDDSRVNGIHDEFRAELEMRGAGHIQSAPASENTCYRL
ncbi:MAG: hypothetical protein JWN98_688 [Abditibacteriota bacterium]|nr:hypothetical protein [Abditibacteriota bacterium]